MATPSRILAWEIPSREEPGELQSTGSQRVRHDLAQHMYFILLVCQVGNATKQQARQSKNCTEGLLCIKLWTRAPINSDCLLNTQVHRSPPPVKTWVNTCFFKNHLHPALLSSTVSVLKQTHPQAAM